ncbi:hypothetical protein [Haloferax massiliensis]|uniref:Uncharacterized protein n=1 Tax=Haloferax massiliensis TaxID=1476858 RepID=A0A0D6JMB5_9EURY|nr:hypothetical protein [Haloferax massiliensis]CQR48743.1 hypothetical protein BN996_00190 [Haloferax massiliensis]
MHTPAWAVVFVCLLLTSGLTGLVTATPPRPGTEDNGLTENETATLWSGDSDAYMNETTYRQRYGESRTPIQQLANGTDITFTRPPATAATWTRNDFRDLNAGNSQTSLYPDHASLTSGRFIDDAHATFFAVHPSTRGHLEAGETPLYVAPEGSVRGFVDYRVRIPNTSQYSSSSVRWSLVNDEISEVRLKSDDDVIVRSGGSHTPVLAYQLDETWSTTLTLEADIDVRLKKTTTTTIGNRTQTDVTYRTETITVADSLDVEVYNLHASAYDAAYPNGDTGVAIFQSRPWQGYTLTEDGESRVRGVWRFYTARDPRWDRLTQATATAETEIHSEALPVYVHAYPSRIGPRAEPIRDGPIILDSWGRKRPSPQTTIPDTVAVEVVDRVYTPTYGLAVRTDNLDRDALRVSGIVHGVDATPITSTVGTPRELRESQLTAEVVSQTTDQATIHIELRDTETGSPIDLTADDRHGSLNGESGGGYLTVADQRVRTNESGVAVVTIDQPGIYTARYHPGTWLVANPAYVSDTATVRWHPLGTLDGWVGLLIEVGWQFIPFIVVFYAGRQILQFFGPRDDSERYP